MDGYRLVIGRVDVFPGIFIDFLFGKGPFGILHQKLHDPVFMSGQRDRLFMDEQCPLIRTKRQIIDPQCIVVVAVASAQLHADPSFQFLQRKGLRHIVIGPLLQQFHLALDTVFGRQYDHGRIAVLLELCEHLLAIHARQHQIQQHQIRYMRVQDEQRFAAGIRIQARKALLPQIFTYHRMNGYIIFHDQDRRHPLTYIPFPLFCFHYAPLPASRQQKHGR